MLGLAIATATLAAGCGNWSSADAHAVTYRPEGGGMDAMLDGVLRMDEGCLVVTSQDGTTQYVLAVPEGSRINDDGTAVRIGRRTLQIGEHVELAGGFTTRFELTVPEACASQIDGAADGVFVVSSAR